MNSGRFGGSILFEGVYICLSCTFRLLRGFEDVSGPGVWSFLTTHSSSYMLCDLVSTVASLRSQCYCIEWCLEELVRCYRWVFIPLSMFPGKPWLGHTIKSVTGMDGETKRGKKCLLPLILVPMLPLSSFQKEWIFCCRFPSTSDSRVFSLWPPRAPACFLDWATLPDYRLLLWNF